MTPITTALVGYGFSANTFHLPFLKAMNDFRLTAISTRQTARVHAELPGVETHASAEVMIQHCDAELVIITAPQRGPLPPRQAGAGKG